MSTWVCKELFSNVHRQSGTHRNTSTLSHTESSTRPKSIASLLSVKEKKRLKVILSMTDAERMVEKIKARRRFIIEKEKRKAIRLRN